MKTKISFLKHIRFTGTLAILFFVLSVYLVFANTSSDNTTSAYSSSKIIEIGYEFVSESISEQEIIEQRKDLDFKDAKEDLGFGKFDYVSPEDILVKVTIEPISTEDNFFIINSNTRTKQYIRVYNEDEKLYRSDPTVISYDPNGQFDYYALPVSDENLNLYIYFDKEYTIKGYSRPSFIVGTESELLLTQAYRSIVDFVIAGMLFILGVFILMIFYITGIERHNVVRIFAIAFFLIGFQYIIFSSFVTFAFNEFSQFFLVSKILTYMMLCIISFAIPLLYVFDKRVKAVYYFNILITIVVCSLSASYVMMDEPINANILFNYNLYYMIMSVFSLVLNLYNFEDESDAISIFRIISYCGLVTLNIFFFYYETQSSVNAIRNPYYFVLIMFVSFVNIYIYSIFIYRSKSIRDTKVFLYDEKETIDRIYRSNKNAITTTNINQISENILSDIKGVYPNYKFAMIVHRDLNRQITIPASTEFKGDIVRHANKVFRKYYKRMPKSSFATYFNGDNAVLIFRSSTGEALLVYVKNDKNLTELDEMVSEILASPILLSFNNCRIYDEISNTERELLFAIGNLTFEKSGNFGDLWRQGEYCYLLAKNTGLTEETAKALRVSSYIADIGKVGMGDDLADYSKISPMDEAAFFKHTEIGHNMLSQFGGETMKIAAKCALYHHEKFNGRGYLGKQAEEIPIEARIFMICIQFDEFFAKLSESKKDLKLNELLEESYNYLSMNKQTIFDPLLVQLFIKDKEGIENLIELSIIRKREIEQKEAEEREEREGKKVATNKKKKKIKS